LHKKKGKEKERFILPGPLSGAPRNGWQFPERLSDESPGTTIVHRIIAGPAERRDSNNDRYAYESGVEGITTIITCVFCASVCDYTKSPGFTPLGTHLDYN